MDDGAFDGMLRVMWLDKLLRENSKKMINGISEIDIIEKLNNNKIIIYGTGYVAKKFYNLLEEKSIGNIAYFVTTKGSDEKINNYPIYSIDNITNLQEYLICIATHESVKDEIINILTEKGVNNYIWIYPYIYDMALGNPVIKNEKVSLKKIWKMCEDNYLIVARYLAIEQYYEKNNFGYDVYLKTMELCSSKETASKRLIRFIELIKNWESNGFDQSKPVFLMDDYMIIDGAHRISLAIYHNMEYIRANIYPRKMPIEEIHNYGARINKDYVKQIGIDTNIINCLERKKTEINMIYGE